MYILGDLESDHFGRLHCTTAVMRSINDQVLFVDKRKPPVFEDMPDIDRTGTFPLLTYKHRDDHPLFSLHFTAHAFKYCCLWPILKWRGSHSNKYNSNFESAHIFSWKEELGPIQALQRPRHSESTCVSLLPLF